MAKGAVGVASKKRSYWQTYLHCKAQSAPHVVFCGQELKETHRSKVYGAAALLGTEAKPKRRLTSPQQKNTTLEVVSACWLLNKTCPPCTLPIVISYVHGKKGTNPVSLARFFSTLIPSEFSWLTRFRICFI